MDRIPGEELDLITLRCTAKIPGAEKLELSNICLHHKCVYLDKYTLHIYTCCDPFKTHKMTVKSGLQEVSLALTRLAKEKLCGIELVPGKKLCGNCETKIKKLLNTASSSDEQ